MSALAGKNRQSNVSDSSSDNKKTAARGKTASKASNPLWTSMSTYTGRSTQSHIPSNDKSKHPFDEPFIADTNESLVKELYEHYRPPLELSVKSVASGNEIMRVIVAHAKSKGVFDRVSYASNGSRAVRLKFYWAISGTQKKYYTRYCPTNPNSANMAGHRLRVVIRIP